MMADFRADSGSIRPFLAETVARDCDVIIGAWTERARREQPDAEGSHRSEMLDRLPDLVRAVGAALLEPDASHSADRAHALGAEHGLQRWVAGWRLDEVIRDYQILRHVILEHLERAAGQAIPTTLTGEIGDLLDEAVKSAAVAFVRHQEDHLRESELRGRQIIDAALDAVISIDSQSRILEWNPQAEQVFGWKREEVLGHNLADFIIPQRYREGHLAGVQKFLTTGDCSFLNRRIEIAGLRRDGAEFPVELSIVPVQVGDSYLFSAFVRDITQRKQTEERLARQTLEARLLQQATALAADTNSFEDALRGCLEIVCEITQWPVGHVLLPSDDGALASADIWHVEHLESIEKFRQHTVQMRFSPGVGLPGHVLQTREPVWIRDARTDNRFTRVAVDDALPVRGAVGFPIQIRGEVAAVLEFFASEPLEHDPTLSALIGSVSEQIGRVIERRRAAEDLREAKEAAEQANRAKSEFLANISHELRTPMNAIMGMTELALDEELDTRVRDYLQTAHESADVLLRLLNEILDFSRLESGRFVLESAPFSLRATMEETVKTLSLHASEKGLELALDLPDNTPDDLIGDALRLRQILMNLIGNSIKFTEQGEVIVRAVVESQTADEASLLISVSDTGIGISPADQERIFTPFTQADASTTRHYGGTGLGLAISSQLIGLMGGRLWVESALGQGSTFSFRVRFLRQKPKPTESERQARFEQLRDVPVLIVDDNASNRRILETILSNWSMRPETASDGASALEKIEEAAQSGKQYDVIILDALMPEMDGFTLAERIKSEPQGSATTILMLSSADRQTFARRCEQLDIAEYLEKPISHSELLNSLCRVLGLTHEEPADENGGRSAPSPSHRALHVLLAEDVPANQKLIVSILTRRGHVVEIAQNGREAVELAKRTAFDVILMDVQMPIMDGFQATSILRSLSPSEAAHVPIVAMTAHAMRGDRERCLAAGMDAYISKPVDSRRLVELIESVARPASS
ncbi:MAG TPA: response regulator [Planctomycetaceae bacterium]|nr:response regulator [Planctomycetaceae bacterium]